jgi:hypothetical protein
MSKWGVLYLSQNAVKLWGDTPPKGKDVIGEYLLRLIYINTVGHANEDNGFKCWVSPETQAVELGVLERQVRRGRKQLQQAGLMLDTGEKKGLAKVWQIIVPGFYEWFNELIPPDTASATGASTTVDESGAKSGADNGAKSGAIVSASDPQTKQNQTETTSEQVLFENVIKAELKIIPTQTPINKLKKIKQSYLPIIRDVLEQFPGTENNRDAVTYVLSKVFAGDPRFICTPSTYIELKKHQKF